MECPFYGRHLVTSPGFAVPYAFLAIDQHGNECGLRVDAFTPCRMEMEGKAPDWKQCPWVKEARVEP